MTADGAMPILRVEPAADEPAYGLLARLALRNGGDLRSFVKRAGAPAPYDPGPDEAVALAARLNGEDAAALARRSIAVDASGRPMLQGEVVDRRRNAALGISYGRVCPACLAEDAAMRPGPVACRPHRRAWWDVSAFPCCPRHRIPLVGTCPSCAGKLGRTLRPGACGTCGPVRFPPTRTLPASDLLGQDYLLGRIGAARRRKHALLDRADLGTAADMMTWVGMADLWPGEDRSPGHLRPEERARALTAGMRILAGGAPAFRTVLDAMADLVPPHARSPQVVYGKLQHRLLDLVPPFEWLADELREHAAGHVVVKQGTRLLRDKPGPGAWTSLGALARRCGHSVERVATVARLAGIVDLGDDVRRSTPIEANVADRIAGFIAGTVDVHGACRALGVNRQLFGTMLEAGIVVSAVPNAGTSIPGAYLKEELAALETRVAGTVRLGRKPVGTVTIARAVRTCSRSLLPMIRAVLDGRLATHGRVVGATGVTSALVEIEALLRALPLPVDPDLLTMHEACVALHVSPETLAVLRGSGLLRRHKGSNGRRIVVGYDAREVRAILGTHVGAGHLSLAFDPPTHPKVVHRLLRDAGVRPDIEAPQPLWTRTEAEAALRPEPRFRGLPDPGFGGPAGS